MKESIPAVAEKAGTKRARNLARQTGPSTKDIIQLYQRDERKVKEERRKQIRVRNLVRLTGLSSDYALAVLEHKMTLEEAQREEEQRRREKEEKKVRQRRQQQARTLAQREGINQVNARMVVDGQMTLGKARELGKLSYKEWIEWRQREKKREKEQQVRDLIQRGMIDSRYASQVLDGSLTIEEAQGRSALLPALLPKVRDLIRGRKIDPLYASQVLDGWLTIEEAQSRSALIRGGAVSGTSVPTNVRWATKKRRRR